MVVWIYAGGGQAEREINKFFQRHFPNIMFERKTPQRYKPGPRPDKPTIPYGATGKGFEKIVSDELGVHWKDGVNLIIVLDDLDCDNYDDKKKSLQQAVDKGLTEAAKRGCSAKPAAVIIGLAVPELEAWLIADWENTFQKNHGNCHAALRYELSAMGIDFKNVESFDCFCGTPEYRKISVVLKDQFDHFCIRFDPVNNRQIRYSKDTDTRALLLQIDPREVSKSCPRFNTFWNELNYALVSP